MHESAILELDRFVVLADEHARALDHARAEAMEAAKRLRSIAEMWRAEAEGGRSPAPPLTAALRDILGTSFGGFQGSVLPADLLAILAAQGMPLSGLGPDKRLAAALCGLGFTRRRRRTGGRRRYVYHRGFDPYAWITPEMLARRQESSHSVADDEVVDDIKW